MPEKKSISIAIISDLHCQKYENGNIRTKLHTKLYDKPINKHPVQSFKSIINSEGKKVDYFFVLGDVTNQANEEGFIFGIKLIKELFDSLHAEKLLYAVGNHDLLFGKKEKREPFHMLQNTDDYPFHFKEDNTTEFENKFWANGFCIIEDNNTIILIINSGGELNEKKISNIDDAFLNKIEKELEGYKKSKKIKIAISHYHPIQHSDMDDFYTSLDMIERADRLMDILEKSAFDLYIHGHKHIARLNYSNSIPIFCAGSFSSLENTEKFSIPNTAHFLQIFEKEGLEKSKGIIETWNYNLIDGWRKSKDPDSFFPTHTGFGADTEINELASQVYFHFKYEIDNYLEVKYNAIIEKIPDVQFLYPAQQKRFEEILFEMYSLAYSQINYSGYKSLKKQIR
ncbi:MAG: hypothetical protein C0397_09830 [Odoribacter sp.]|nr:hypothetical protein [Odoribacter sp.]